MKIYKYILYFSYFSWKFNIRFWLLVSKFFDRYWSSFGFVFTRFIKRCLVFLTNGIRSVFINIGGNLLLSTFMECFYTLRHQKNFKMILRYLLLMMWCIYSGKLSSFYIFYVKIWFFFYYCKQETNINGTGLWIIISWLFSKKKKRPEKVWK